VSVRIYDYHEALYYYKFLIEPFLGTVIISMEICVKGKILHRANYLFLYKPLSKYLTL